MVKRAAKWYYNNVLKPQNQLMIPTPGKINQAIKWAKIAKEMINAEKKGYQNMNSTATDVTTSGLIVYLSDISQGLDYQNRVGNSIKAKSIQFRFIARFNDDTLQKQTMRIFLIQDKENQGEYPVLDGS